MLNSPDMRLDPFPPLDRHHRDENVLGLRENQQSAVALGVANLHAERNLPHQADVTEAAHQDADRGGQVRPV